MGSFHFDLARNAATSHSTVRNGKGKTRIREARLRTSSSVANLDSRVAADKSAITRCHKNGDNTLRFVFSFGILEHRAAFESRKGGR